MGINRNFFIDFQDGNSILYLDSKYPKSEIKKENFYFTGNGNWTEDQWDDVELDDIDKIVSSQFNNKIVIKNNDYPDYKPPTLISFQLDQNTYDISQGDLIFIKIEDKITGVEGFEIYFKSPSSTQVVI